MSNQWHDDIIKWKHFSRYWLFVRRIHWSPVNSPHKGQWRRALMISLICARINGWVNNGDAGNLRRHRAHFDVYIWLVLPHLSCGGDTCQIWMWFNESTSYFCKIENFVYAEINERSFSNPHPWTQWFTFYKRYIQLCIFRRKFVYCDWSSPNQLPNILLTISQRWLRLRMAWRGTNEYYHTYLLARNRWVNLPCPQTRDYNVDSTYQQNYDSLIARHFGTPIV